ncbi:MAG: elongation factor G [Caldilineaceae bacterium]|nr:elongation factor G [Caldilineaceae bacterium]HRJ41764.1 elongation factor G [Caldilineaceae bacterium]
MTKFTTAQLRNVAIVGHGSSGKTSLTEALLFNSGVLSRMGRVEDGTTVSDWDAEEQRRKISINLSVVPVVFKDIKLNLVDTPGYLDFMGEVISALAVCEAGLVLVDSVAGVEVGTELAWERLNSANKPRLVFVNKMDRENANYQRVLTDLQETFAENTIVPFQLPIGSAETFQGVVNLVDMKAYMGREGQPADIPAEMMEQVNAARQVLVDAAAETDDELIMKYLDGEDLTEDEVRHGLHDGVRRGQIVPVFCGTATGNIALYSLIRAMTSYVPAPNEAQMAATIGDEAKMLNSASTEPTAALVFKTIVDRYVGRMNYIRICSGSLKKDDHLRLVRTGKDERVQNVFSVMGKELESTLELIAGDIGVVTKMEELLTTDTLSDLNVSIAIAPPVYPTPLYTVAVVPATKADSAKMGQGLQALTEEDPTLSTGYVAATKQNILQGMGESHIDAAVRSLETKFGVKVETSLPKVSYQETVTRHGSAHYRHKKQTGGAGQFADVQLRVEPMDRGSGFEYASEVFGGAIPTTFIPSIEKGIRQVLDQGVIAGFPIVDVKAIVFDGKYHPVDSKDIAFQTAGREGFKQAMREAGPALLEPIYNIQVTVPDEYMGDVMGDLNTRRGRVQGMEQRGNRTIVRAQVPLAEILRYGTDLRSMTQGRGIYAIEFDHYDPVPSHLTDGIVEQNRQEHEEIQD